MKAVENTQVAAAAELDRSDELFREHQDSIYRRSDRLFANLMVFQWLAGVGAALWISPRAWSGAQSQVHLHVWAAVFLGGLITSFPVALAWLQPGRALTRHAIAIGQMLTSALLIHLTGGRIETHFHVFGSLAFLAFYRDWKVLTSATVIVAADHFLRGAFWPQSVFGVLTANHWRWLEHAGWVIFEDIFLFISVHQSLREMRAIAERQAGLESLNQTIELRVQERTRELQLEIQERKEAEIKLERSHEKLLEASRQAGKAEVATSVLHNVNNVLNSVTTSAGIVSSRVRESKAAQLEKVAAMLREHEHDLAEFLKSDPKGSQVRNYLEKLCHHLAEEQSALVGEMNSLVRNVAHIRDVIAMQQCYAKVCGQVETVNLPDLVEDALGINASVLAGKDVRLAREYAPRLPEISVEKHKVLQILVNLIRNARHACDEAQVPEKCLTLRLTNGGNRVRVSVIDNGIGIPPENLARIFNHGFTTKKEGHGFGLHSSVLAAREMGGDLLAHSEGPGRGAIFTLELPVHATSVPLA